MKKGIIGLLTLASVFSFAITTNNSTIETKAEEAYTHFVKVTENKDDWSGTYLIVSEEYELAFNGSKTSSIDSANSVKISFTNGMLNYDTYKNYTFTFSPSDKGGYATKGTIGQLIFGLTENAAGKSDPGINGNKSGAYTNSISIENNNVIIQNETFKDKGINQLSLTGTNFRYYKVGDANIKDIQLYEPVTLTEEISASEKLKTLTKSYYNSGSYTKKSHIYLNDTAQTEYAKYFHTGKASTERTTYYKDGGLLMADIDGTLTKINSGYGTVTEDNKAEIESQLKKTVNIGDLTHFRFNEKTGKPVYNYTVDKSHENWDDTTKDGMEGFYVTLSDFTEANYFEGWTKKDDGYSYNLVGKDLTKDQTTKDFLNFAAPLVLDTLLDATSNKYLLPTELFIKENEGKLYFQILCDGTDATGKLTNGNIFAESIISTGHNYVAPAVTEWTLVTDESQLVDGAKIMIAAATTDNHALGIQKTNNRDVAIITKEGNKAISTYEIILTLGKEGDLYTIHDGNGYLQAVGKSNYLKTQDKIDEKSMWNISIEEGYATIYATVTVDGENEGEKVNLDKYIRYNASSDLFSSYDTAASTNQKDVVIYILAE